MVNKILTTLFAGQGDAYVRDNGDMSMTYIFKFIPTDVQVSIIQNSGVLPRPAGVSVSMHSIVRSRASGEPLRGCRWVYSPQLTAMLAISAFSTSMSSGVLVSISITPPPSHRAGDPPA